MQKVIIEGPVTLKGEINISGSKNASLPIMISTVLSKGSCLISNVPNLRDTRFLVSILQDLGCNVDFQKISLRFITLQLEKNLQIMNMFDK